MEQSVSEFQYHLERGQPRVISVEELQVRLNEIQNEVNRIRMEYGSFPIQQPYNRFDLVHGRARYGSQLLTPNSHLTCLPQSLPNTPTDDMTAFGYSPVVRLGPVMEKEVGAHPLILTKEDLKRRVFDLSSEPIKPGDHPRTRTEEEKTYVAQLMTYNGMIDANDALERALELSCSESTEPSVLSDYFVKLFTNKSFEKALLFRDRVKTISKDGFIMIDDYLDQIPWRISCESYQEDGKVKWLNSWIKIGWWEDDIEISPQLKSDHYIDTDNITCVVMRGTSKDMLLRMLMKISEKRVNIELNSDNGYLVPVDIEVAKPRCENSIFDLAVIEIGSMTKTSDCNLDLYRTLTKSRKDSDKVYFDFYRGCTFTESFSKPDNIFDLSDNDDIELYVSDVDE